MALLLLPVTSAVAGTVTLTWDAVTAQGLAGYAVYFGSTAGSYPNRIDVGNVTTFTVGSLTDNGTYYFVVTAYDGSRTESSYSNSVAKIAVPGAPVRTAAFSASATSGPAPLTVNFASYYTGVITSYAWSFGDGTTSTSPTPIKVYSTVGTYTVSLTVTGPGGMDQQVRANLITVSSATGTPPSGTPPPARTASFTASALAGNAPLAVNFTSFYTGSITSYAWNFGDGTTSSQSAPTKVYSAAGTYSVTLTVTGPGGTDVESRPNLIYVAPTSVVATVPAPVSNFISSAIVGTVPLPVDFYNYSTGVIGTYFWSFGDGTTSTLRNPTKVYTSTGDYSVTLTVTGTGGSNTKTRSRLVTVLPIANTLMTRLRLATDVHAGAGTSSNLNGIVEPGETVLFEPTWRNDTSAPMALTSTASALTGPPGTAYTLSDGSASFGIVAPSGAANCLTSSGDCYTLGVTVPGTRPAAHWDAQFTETLSNGVTLQSALHIGKSFTDVPETDGAYRAIETILHNNITTGFEDGTFRPYELLNRRGATMLVARAIVAPIGDGAIPESGMADGHAYSCVVGGKSLIRDMAPTGLGCKQAHFLLSKDVNISLGCTAPRLCATDHLNRASMAVLLAGAVAADGDAGVPKEGTFSDAGVERSYNCAILGGSHFADVGYSDKFCRHVNYLWARDMLVGNLNGTFNPAGMVTNGEMAQFLVESLALTLD